MRPLSWIAKERVAIFSKEEKAKFLPLTPDFVLELMSHSDNLKDTQAKMEEYKDNEAKLGCLIRPEPQKVEVYRLNKKAEVVNKPGILTDDGILPNLVVKLDFIWQ